MKKIHMVDLQSQYKKIKPQINKAIANVLDTAHYINGPQVKQFATDLEKYLDVKHVIPCANGTDALQIALMGLKLQPGDEVITVDFTFAATVEVAALLKLTPVLVDIDEDSFNMNIEALKKAITSKTKAIIPVHLFGQCANMEAIMEIAKAHHLFVIEDNAQAIGADYTFSNGKTQKSGTIGHVGTTSFFPSKNLGCYGDGGAIFTNDDDLAYQFRGIINHGMINQRYHHDIVGVNSRLDSLQAAILQIKLPLLDSYCNARQKVANYYNDAFADCEYLETPITNAYSTHVFHQYTLKTHRINRDALREYLLTNNIPCAIYYPIPLHNQKAYANSRYKESDFSITNHLCKTVISLPIHTEMEKQQQAFIVKTVLDFCKR